MDRTHTAIMAQAHDFFQRNNTPAIERVCILELISIVTSSAEMLPPTPEREAFVRRVTSHLLADHSLLTLVRQQTAELGALKRISLNLTASLDLQQVLDLVVSEAMHLLEDARDAHIFLYHNEKLIFGSALDKTGERNKIFALPRPNGLTYNVARSKQKIIVEDIRNHFLFQNSNPDWNGSIISIPLMMGDRVIGVMNLARNQAGSFSTSDLRMLELLADQAAIAIINARLHEAVAKQAYTDILTNLPNRRALDERLEIEVQRARRYNGAFSVVMMDLDGFKSVNDTYGHAIGDMVLQKTFDTIASTLRNSDFLARYGGDELTMILPEADFDATLTVAQKLQERLQAMSIEMPDGEMKHFNLSGGIAVYPTNARTAADLLRSADEALYRAKRNQRGAFFAARGSITGQLA